jgi:hypothetical protein
MVPSVRNANGGLTSVGGAAAAAGIGLAAGAMVYGAIDMAGKSDYEKSVHMSSDIGSGLANLHGQDIGTGLIEAQEKLRKYQDDKGIVGGAFSGMMNLFGAGDSADVKGMEDLIARKKIEYADWQNAGGKPTASQAPQVEQQKMVKEQADSVKVFADAVKVFASNSGQPAAAGSVPNRGNSPSPVK